MKKYYNNGTLSTILLATCIVGAYGLMTPLLLERTKQFVPNLQMTMRLKLSSREENDAEPINGWSKNNRPIISHARRKLLGGALSLVAATAPILCNAGKAHAKDEIFKPNPWTNPVLEQIRIWEQAEADTLKYGGELEAGDAGNKGKVGAYPKLLIPILEIDQELTQVKTLVRDDTENRSTSWSTALAILQNPKYEKVPFKKTFNAYGDNIYYSDPDRANMYLGGGATPKTEQSLAYLLRNDILTNVEDLRAELEYLLKSGEKDVEDLYTYADLATNAMKKYLDLVPPNEYEQAKNILAAGR